MKNPEQPVARYEDEAVHIICFLRDTPGPVGARLRALIEIRRITNEAILEIRRNYERRQRSKQ